MSVIRLMPDQIAGSWDFYKEGFRKSLPPASGNHDIALSNIFQNLMADSMQMFVSYKDDEPTAGVITMIRTDPGTYARKLLIYAFVKFTRLDTFMIQEGWEVLSEFARSYKCGFIEAYTQESNVISIAEKLGADTSWCYISKRV